MDDASGHELNYSLESLPRSLFRGYDRKATEQLFGRLNRSYKNLQIERARIARELDDSERELAENGEAAERLGGELERLQTELNASEEREKSLRERLDKAKSFMDGEVERIRAEATHELERVQADAERDLDHARGELARFERRELLLEDMLDTTRRTVESIKEEARADAELILKKARHREAKIVGNARSEHEGLEAERRRLTATAAELRDDLSAVLVSTLEQLTPTGKPQAEEKRTAEVENANGRRGDSTGEDGASPSQASGDGATLAANDLDPTLQNENGATGPGETVKTAASRRPPRK